MQAATGNKKKFRIEQYISADRANPIIQNINNQTQVLSCICKTMTEQGQKCFKCGHFVHVCLAPEPNRNDRYECASCLNKNMDPLYQVVKVLNQSYFRTQSIYHYSNVVNFEFTIRPEDKDAYVEVRGLIPGQTSLGWPMQGGFSLNDQKTSFHQFKPLLINSNRKARRQEYFTTPMEKLKLGKNYLRFKIPCLDKNRYGLAYKAEEKKQYFLAINIVKRLSPAELETLTFRERRTEQKDSIEILKQNNSDVEITQNKVSLMCPYTRQRIKVPVRGRYCKHFSCICLQTLIATHSRSRFWNCPLCDNKLNQPYVDVWIYNMLIDNQKGKEVLVKEDGTYEWIKEAEDDALNLDSDEDSPPFRPAQQLVPQKMCIEAPQKNAPVQLAIQIEDNEANQVNIVDPSIVNYQKKTKPEQSKDPQKQENITNLVAEEEDSSKKRRQLFQKMKQKTKQNELLEKAPVTARSQSNPSSSIVVNIEEESRKISNKRLSFESLFKAKLVDMESKSKENIKKVEAPVQKKVIIHDVRPLELKQLRPQQFKKTFFKGRTNKYKKYVQTQQIRRLFKEIL